MQFAGLTFNDMQNRVAVALSVTIGSDGLPADANERTLIQNAINDTIIEVYGTHEFNWSRREHSFAIGTGSPQMVNEDPSRYLLPNGAEGFPVGRVSFSTPGGGSSGNVYMTTVSAVRERLLDSSSTGAPIGCAFHQPMLATLGNRGSWEMLVYPRPATAYTITAMFETPPAKFVLGSEMGPWSVECDLAIVEGAKRNVARTGKMPTHVSILDCERMFAEALARAVAKDTERHPRNQNSRSAPMYRGVSYSNVFFTGATA